MSTRIRFVLVVVCALISIISLGLYTQEIRSGALSSRDEALEAYGADTTEVVVTTRDIAAGERLDESNLTYGRWVVDLLPHGVVTNIEDVSGQISAGPLASGQALSELYFVENQDARLEVPEGHEALSLKLEKSHALSGLIEVGTHVDIYERSAHASVLVSEHVRVLASSLEGSGYVYLTLLVPSDQIEEILQAEQTSDVYITLPARAGGDQ